MPASRPDYILDITGLKPDPTGPPAAGSLQGRPWIAVRWKCCRAYSRVYRNRTGTAYEGRCPRCGTPVRASVGPGGTASRFFEAS